MNRRSFPRAILLVAVVASMAGCESLTEYHRLMGADQLIIIPTEPGKPPVVVRKDPQLQA